MREIKFRGWSGCSMHYWKLNELNKLNDLQLERFIFMQYTGRKDKNSKEIYDSDIIKTKNGKNGWFVWKVEWDNRGGWVQVSIGYLHNANQKNVDDWIDKPDLWFNGFPYNYEKGKKSCHIAWYLDNYPSGEVIGNIYENPELLK